MTGTAYVLPSSFGSFEVEGLLRAAATSLPKTALVELANPIGHALKHFLRGRAKRVGSLLNPKWKLATAELNALADFAGEHRLKRLAVWLSFEAPDGITLMEAEDGNSTIWLADRLSEETRHQILEACGGSVSQFEGASLLP